MSDADIRITLYALCESVAERLCGHGFRCRTVVITIRDNELFSYEWQMKLERPACTAKESFDAAYALYRKHHAGGKPVRSLGVRAANLLLDPVQLSLYPDVAKAQAQERLEEAVEEAVDDVRERFGHFCIQRGLMLTDPQFSALNPVDDHIIHPIGFLT